MYSYRQSTGTNGLNMAPRRNYPLAFGATQPAEETFMEKTKRVLGEDNSLVGLKNGYLLGGAAVLGLVYYGYTHRWF